jgi:hypothetical protein
VLLELCPVAVDRLLNVTAKFHFYACKRSLMLLKLMRMSDNPDPNAVNPRKSLVFACEEVDQIKF